MSFVETLPRIGFAKDYEQAELSAHVAGCGGVEVCQLTFLGRSVQPIVQPV
jgi:hypothetical protein